GGGGGEGGGEEGGGGPSPGRRDPAGGGQGKLLSPPRRRRAVAWMRARLGVSERRACRVLGQARSTQRHRPRPRPEEARLVLQMVALATAYGRYGDRRITALLRPTGWRGEVGRH